MSAPRVNRSLIGNLAVGLVLVLIAVLLLRLHLGESWWLAAPLPAQWFTALTAAAIYAIACAALWWQVRPRKDVASVDGEPPLLVVWASQTGFARQLAERTADSLQAAGHHTRLRALDQVDAALLARTRTALIIASTTGEGDPPDHALAFLSRVMQDSSPLPQLQYAMLALGDRTYDHYCAFGHQLDDWLRRQGAHALFDTIEVDNADPAALRHWQQLLGQLGGDTGDLPDWTAPDYQSWQLVGRQHLNPGSAGGAVYQLRLRPTAAGLPQWQAGDIAEVGPQHSDARVAQWLQLHGLDGQAAVEGGTLQSRLARSHLPGADAITSRDPQLLAASLQPLPHREYSIGSTPAEGHLQLLLRCQFHADGSPGLGSGWLCEQARIGDSIALRLRSNPNFHPPAVDQPLILIGNGTGIAGLRAHLQARIEAGARRNWLLFGERNAACDFHFGAELQQWRQQGWIEQLDTVFSRDNGRHRYVQDALADARDRLRQWIAQGATVLVCGSLQGMAPAVDAVIADALGSAAHDALRIAGRYRRDVY
ncbi:sulfite reductase subunit alpha [Stenotrophomonas sp. YIM B06876]|uniref:sulfite reductase subunit alpha n=1 Tax=Stenotrophomonas sp. YIM B06876 TaxID=3060211 RepID=UPI002738E9FE|nr:sulfite reductase subunit alpha [Stenotrophomonas sp. YIM B06876]